MKRGQENFRVYNKSLLSKGNNKKIVLWFWAPLTSGWFNKTIKDPELEKDFHIQPWIVMKHICIHTD